MISPHAYCSGSDCSKRYDESIQSVGQNGVVNDELRSDISQEMYDCKNVGNQTSDALAVTSASLSQCQINLSDKEKESKLCEDELSKYRDLFSTCRLELVESNSNFNEALQKFISLEERYTHLQSSHNRSAAIREEKIADLKLELKKMERQAELSRERYIDSRSDVTRLEKALLEMNYKSRRTYVNTTLIAEDITRFVSRRVDRIYRYCERFAKKASPRYKRMRSDIRASYRQYERSLAPRLEVLTRRLLGILRFIVRIGEMHHIRCIDTPVMKFIAVRASTILQAVRLSLICIVEQTCEIVLNHFKLVSVDPNEKSLPLEDNRIIQGTHLIQKNSEKIVDCLGVSTFCIIILSVVLNCFRWVIKMVTVIYKSRALQGKRELGGKE